MIKVGLHNGYWLGAAEWKDPFRLLELTHRAGLEVIELNVAHVLGMSADACGEFLRRLKDNGMFATVNNGLEPANDLAADSGEVRRSGIDYCLGVLRKLPLLEIRVWCGINYSAWLRAPVDADSREEKKRARALALESLGKILPAAEDAGVDYCFEVVNRYEQFIFNTSVEAVAFAEEANSPRAKVHLDTYHMNIEEDDIPAAIVHAGTRGRLGHIHVGESNRRVPGVGATHIDWNGVAEALADVGYQGAVVMEPFVLSASPNAKKLRVWRDLCRDSDLEALTEDARKGGEFLRGVLAPR
ncbi:MAG: sugar phosphate isomerase/epimerase [Planctomycetes bacterium]|nr:sugar phosphate isomerase/epimerase [Planctomycetota bacterium]